VIFLSIIKNPFSQANHFKNKLRWLVIFTLGNLLINIPFAFLLEFGEAPISEEFFNNLNLFQQFILAAVIPAIFEEYIFRYPLCLKKHSFNIIFLLSIPFTILLVFNFSQISFYLIVLSIIIYTVLKNKIRLLLSNKNNSIIVFYGMSILFALSHTGNYSSDPISTKVVMTFLVFVSAIFFGLTRIHIGFKYAILSHFFYNTIIIILSHITR
jgi:hypothetical protein